MPSKGEWCIFSLLLVSSSFLVAVVIGPRGEPIERRQRLLAGQPSRVYAAVFVQQRLPPELDDIIHRSVRGCRHVRGFQELQNSAAHGYVVVKWKRTGKFGTAPAVEVSMFGTDLLSFYKP